MCGGKEAYFSVIAVDGGTNPSYQSKVNGTNVGTATVTIAGKGDYDNTSTTTTTFTITPADINTEFIYNLKNSIF